MIIRKLFKFENAHIVRNCSTSRCSQNIHGHSYKVELLLESDTLDNGQMVYDFGLIKGNIKELVDSFDHAISLWDGDDAEYLEYAKKFSARYIMLPISPSAEQLSRVIFLIVEKLLDQTNAINGEENTILNSVIVHETETGYAQCFKADAHSKKMGIIDLEKIIFSNQIRSEWSDSELWSKLLKGEQFTNPKIV
jgi:6-pyruvoyltetrahydropterin/6-carboxytetrahydropterin synthase